MLSLLVKLMVDFCLEDKLEKMTNLRLWARETRNSSRVLFFWSSFPNYKLHWVIGLLGYYPHPSELWWNPHTTHPGVLHLWTKLHILVWHTSGLSSKLGTLAVWYSVFHVTLPFGVVYHSGIILDTQAVSRTLWRLSWHIVWKMHHPFHVIYSLPLPFSFSITFPSLLSHKLNGKLLYFQ